MKKSISVIAAFLCIATLFTSIPLFAVDDPNNYTYYIDDETRHTMRSSDGVDDDVTLYNGYTLSLNRDGNIIYIVAFDNHGKLKMMSFNEDTFELETVSIVNTDEDGRVKVEQFLSGSYFTLNKTVAEIVDAAAEIIYRNEGSYSSVNANDNGALSIGKVQWHANRALSLLKTIVNANPSNALTILGAALYSEIVTAASNAWTSRTVNSTEKSAISALLSTPAGISAQDALALTDITSYVNHGINVGIRSSAALVYFADIENQCGSGGSSRIASSAAIASGSYDKISLLAYHTAALADSVAGRYSARRNTVYTYASELGWETNTDDGLPEFMGSNALSSFAQYYPTLAALYPSKATNANSFINAVMALDCGNSLSFSGATNSYREAYVNTMIKYYLLYEYGYTTVSGAPDTSKKYRSVRNLMNGKSVVFFFEGASNNTESIYSNFNTYHFGAICVVIKLNSSNLPYIAYINQNSTTIPDRVRHLYSKYSMTTVGTVLDGIYDIISVNHDGYIALNVKSDTSAYVPSIRANKTDTSYIGTSSGINIHRRYTNEIVSETSDWSNTIGCFTVGMLGQGSTKFNEYNNFIKAVTGTSANAVTASGDSVVNTPCASAGISMYQDMGIVIVDRFLYKDELAALFGNDATYTSSGGAYGSSASSIVSAITQKTNAHFNSDPSLYDYILSESDTADQSYYSINILPCTNGRITANKTAARKGETVILTVTPAKGYKLKYLYIDGVDILSKTFTVSGNHTVYAIFEEDIITYSLTARVLSYCNTCEISASLEKNGSEAYSFESNDQGWIGQMYDTITFSQIEPGTYDLIIKKRGHLTYSVKGININTNIDMSGKPIVLDVGDINNDSFIDSVDVSLLVYDMGKTSPNIEYDSDLNGDGYCDALDVSVLAFNLLKTPTVEIF